MLKIVVLVMAVIMPQDVPDVQRAVRVDSVEECWAAAKKFTERELTADMKAHGALGFSAGCVVVEKSKDQHEQQEEEKGKL